ncbi:MAG: GntR family transcriptional regulator [Syntrophobacterales bacterium]|nr:GntR family transcriptional regulator [Syntrophobacterales bacterium]
MAKLQREKLSHQIYAVLKEMIADHRFQPGARLNIESIARELDVSRTPVWEAVRRLEQEGLVENIPNRGVFMSSLTAAQALDLYAVREVLEGMAARLAATRMDDSSLENMAQCIQRQREVIENQDYLAYSKLDFEFHAAVYDACGNEWLRELLETIKNKMRPLTLHMQPDFSKLIDQHAELLQALRGRDPEKAEEAFRRHNQYMMAQIREDVDAGRWKQLGGR